MDAVARLLADLVAIDSVNPDLVPGGAGEGAIARFIADWLGAAGLEVRLDEVRPGRPNVIAIARGGGGGPTLMLNGHVDTVGVAGMADAHRPIVEGGRLYGRGVVFRETLIECLGTGASVRGIASRMSDTHLVETVLRVSVAADTQEPVSRFAREIASLVTSGPQGTTGYASGRPPVLPVFGYWPCRMGRDQLQPAWTFL